MCESFFATLECELLDRTSFKSSDRSAHGGLRIHRRVVQPSSPPFRHRLSVAHRLRTSIRCTTWLSVQRTTGKRHRATTAGGGENRERTRDHQPKLRRTIAESITKPDIVYRNGVAPLLEFDLDARQNRRSHATGDESLRFVCSIPHPLAPAWKAAVIVTINLPFWEWTTVIPNARPCKALIDRITDRANIIETGTEFYRFRRLWRSARVKVWTLRASTAQPPLPGCGKPKPRSGHH